MAVEGINEAGDIVTPRVYVVYNYLMIGMQGQVVHSGQASEIVDGRAPDTPEAVDELQGLLGKGVKQKLKLPVPVTKAIVMLTWWQPLAPRIVKMATVAMVPCPSCDKQIRCIAESKCFGPN